MYDKILEDKVNYRIFVKRNNNNLRFYSKITGVIRQY